MIRNRRGQTLNFAWILAHTLWIGLKHARVKVEQLHAALLII
jgi:hypothetical protein